MSTSNGIVAYFITVKDIEKSCQARLEKDSVVSNAPANISRD